MLAFGTVNTKVPGAASQLYSDGKGYGGKRSAIDQFVTFLERLSGITRGASK